MRGSKGDEDRLQMADAIAAPFAICTPVALLSINWPKSTIAP